MTPLQTIFNISDLGVIVCHSVVIWSKDNHAGPDAGMFRERLVNIMAVDTMAPCVIRPSASMVLTMQIKQAIVFPEG